MEESYLWKGEQLISLKYLRYAGAANLTARDTLSLGAHRRPLSESLSAPGFQQQQSASGVSGASAEFTQQYESLLRQFNVQNQQLLLQGHLMQQQYLEQQQRY